MIFSTVKEMAKLFTDRHPVTLVRRIQVFCVVWCIFNEIYFFRSTIFVKYHKSESVLQGKYRKMYNFIPNSLIQQEKELLFFWHNIILIQISTNKRIRSEKKSLLLMNVD